MTCGFCKNFTVWQDFGTVGIDLGLEPKMLKGYLPGREFTSTDQHGQRITGRLLEPCPCCNGRPDLVPDEWNTTKRYWPPNRRGEPTT